MSPTRAARWRSAGWTTSARRATSTRCCSRCSSRRGFAGLFALTPEELGLAQGGQPRAIPLELQRLFARMMRLDQASVRTDRLISAFGWSRSDEVIQHDAQELNRVLFAAVEQSLKDTSGHDLISRLYGCRFVNFIQCKECPYRSEREELFLDLTVRAGVLPFCVPNVVRAAVLCHCVPNVCRMCAECVLRY